MDTPSNEFLRSRLETTVLTLLAEAAEAASRTPSGRMSAGWGRMYGYEITQAVNKRTGGEMTLSFGALYPVLHKLESDGLLTTETKEVEGRLRKYYSLTPRHDTARRQTLAGFRRFADTVRALLKVPLNPASPR